MADAIDPPSNRAKEDPPEPRTASAVSEQPSPGQPEQPPAAGAPGPGTTHSPPSHRWRRLLVPLLLATGLPGGAYALFPTIMTALNTISTDDAYVNGHVTFVAPRVPGQVERRVRR